MIRPAVFDSENRQMNRFGASDDWRSIVQRRLCALQYTLDSSGNILAADGSVYVSATDAQSGGLTVSGGEIVAYATPGNTPTTGTLGPQPGVGGVATVQQNEAVLASGGSGLQAAGSGGVQTGSGTGIAGIISSIGNAVSSGLAISKAPSGTAIKTGTTTVGGTGISGLVSSPVVLIGIVLLVAIVLMEHH
jgi:hypothetical protein